MRIAAQALRAMCGGGDLLAVVREVVLGEAAFEEGAGARAMKWVGFLAAFVGLAIAYALMRNRTRTPAEKQHTEAVTQERYRAEDVKEGVRPMPE